ncbi:hypothetical protein F2Q69_00044389 [Brassica cretica]|uniref:F-box domain-containing protein n=1 Tax=Brassica cretica TaxID=69181 RepID=A0A8S9NKJ6_BRACR|nr:hypothetical protein F2Q69_00044389 [Brassica cretica]
MNVTLMDYFPILELPEEIQALVVERVAGNSFTYLYGLRASCKTMKALAEWSRKEGLAFMKVAADEGYERAVIGKLVRSLKWAWGLSHSDEFLPKRDEFISTVVPSFYSCQCVICIQRTTLHQFTENKDDEMNRNDRARETMKRIGF